MAAKNTAQTNPMMPLRALDAAAFQQLGTTVRIAVGMLGLSKPQMTEVAEWGGDEDWFALLDELQVACEILAGLCNIIEQAESRSLVAAAVLAARQHSPAAHMPRAGRA